MSRVTEFFFVLNNPKINNPENQYRYGYLDSIDAGQYDWGRLRRLHKQSKKKVK